MFHSFLFDDAELQFKTAANMTTVAPEAVWVWVPSATLAVIATITKATRKIFLGHTGMCKSTIPECRYPGSLVRRARVSARTVVISLNTPQTK